ncbi:MAG: anaerobic ribonucleoside-triphosphate reductase activating protein [Spirochaetales bacterium]|nr:anaerobic ribonucleoside-triphosphate reductase activating protein [Spirochaetales bacterium]
MQKTSLIDFPGTVSCVLFTRGCNLRCPYCHNPELVEVKPLPGMIKKTKVFEYIDKRKHLLKGLCITGGEPLIHSEIDEFAHYGKKHGLKVKLDTNGLLPERLERLDVDFIAMDIKTVPEKYDRVGAKGQTYASRIRESIKWILNSGISHEFRTTVVPGIVDFEDIMEIGAMIKGADHYVLAQFRKGRLLDPAFLDVEPYPLDTLMKMKNRLEEMGISCTVRVV